MADSIAFGGRFYKRRKGYAYDHSLKVALTPILLSVNYDQGDTKGGGESIVLTGLILTNAVSVSFGSTAATITGNTSTTVTCTLPAKSAGSTSVTVSTLSGGTSNGLPFEYWDPGELSATTGFWEDYEGTSWTARGGSVAGTMTAPGTAPDVGTGAGGFTSADTPGGNSGKYLRSSGTGCFIEDYVTIATQSPGPGTTAWVLFKPRTAGADGGTSMPYINRGLLSTNAGGYFIVSHTVNGFVCGYYDGAYDAVTAPCSLGTGISGLNAWHVGVFVYNGTTMQASVDGSALASASSAHGLPDDTGNDTYRLQVCIDYSATNGFDGEILAFGTTKDVSTDAEVTKLRKWAQQRFGITA